MKSRDRCEDRCEDKKSDAFGMVQSGGWIYYGDVRCNDGRNAHGQLLSKNFVDHRFELRDIL